jgi:hypothetical protein
VAHRTELRAHFDFIGRLTEAETLEMADIDRKLEDFDQDEVAAAEDEAFQKASMAQNQRYEDTFRMPEGC